MLLGSLEDVALSGIVRFESLQLAMERVLIQSYWTSSGSVHRRRVCSVYILALGLLVLSNDDCANRDRRSDPHTATAGGTVLRSTTKVGQAEGP